MFSYQFCMLRKITAKVSVELWILQRKKCLTTRKRSKSSFEYLPQVLNFLLFVFKSNVIPYVQLLVFFSHKLSCCYRYRQAQFRFTIGYSSGLYQLRIAYTSIESFVLEILSHLPTPILEITLNLVATIDLFRQIFLIFYMHLTSQYNDS